jgi:hypothetical protein
MRKLTIRKQMNKLILGLVFATALGCGVKGPPEPPLPTEGSLKKELQQEQAAPPQPVPPPAPVKKSKKTKAPKTQDQ